MSTPSNILVIRLSALGDVAMTVPVLLAVTQSYPDLKITVVSRSFYEPIFAEIPNCNFLVADVYGKHKGVKLFSLAEEAVSLGIDAVADLHNVIRSKILTNYFKVKGIKSVAIKKGRAKKKALTHAKGKEITALKSTHKRYAQVFSQLGFPADLQGVELLDKKPLSPRLHNILKGEKKAIGVAPFAAYTGKMYPSELMEEVISNLNDVSNFHIYLFGGGQHEINVLSDLAKKYKQMTNLAGQLTFEEELCLISNLDLMFSMDSGNGHLAANYGVPVVTLWGVTHPHAGFKPFNQPEENQLLANRNEFPLIPTSVYGNKYPSGYENAMATIAPKSIIQRIFEILN